MHFEDLVAAYARLPYLKYKPSLLRLVDWAEARRNGARPEKYAVVKTARGAVRLNVNLSAWLQREMFYHGTFEPDTQRFIQSRCVAGGTVVDVGANIGVYTTQMSRLVGNSGRVYAFEPTTAFHERLIRNLDLNGCRNVTCEKLIVSNDNMPRAITVDYQTASINLPCQGTTEIVQSVTLDDYFGRKLKRLDLIKVDVDGWDYYVLAGAISLLERLRPAVIVECVNYGPVPPDAIWNLLDSLNYSLRLDSAIDRELTKSEFDCIVGTTSSVNLVGYPR